MSVSIARTTALSCLSFVGLCLTSLALTKLIPDKRPTNSCLEIYEDCIALIAHDVPKDYMRIILTIFVRPPSHYEIAVMRKFLDENPTVSLNQTQILQLCTLLEQDITRELQSDRIKRPWLCILRKYEFLKGLKGSDRHTRRVKELLKQFTDEQIITEDTNYAIEQGTTLLPKTLARRIKAVRQ